MSTQDAIKTTKPSAGVAVVSPSTDIDLSRSPDLRAALRHALDDGAKKLVVDLGGVEYMDSSGLATLVEIMRHAKSSGATMRLAALNEKVRAIFEIARLDQFFTIVPTVDDALNA
ncbi:MAG: STAS domain-containing protein [Phycisphaerales bacterium JB040]